VRNRTTSDPPLGYTGWLELYYGADIGNRLFGGFWFWLVNNNQPMPNQPMLEKTIDPTEPKTKKTEKMVF
jgi:hypothetical protein